MTYVLAAAAHHTPSTLAILAVIGVGVVAVVMVRLSGRASGRRRAGLDGYVPIARDVENDRPSRRGTGYREDRTPAAFFGAIRRKPGNALWAGTCLAFLAATWADRGVESAAITMGILAVLIFPCGYLWWRRWGPPT